MKRYVKSSPVSLCKSLTHAGINRHNRTTRQSRTILIIMPPLPVITNHVAMSVVQTRVATAMAATNLIATAAPPDRDATTAWAAAIESAPGRLAMLDAQTTGATATAALRVNATPATDPTTTAKMAQIEANATSPSTPNNEAHKPVTPTVTTKVVMLIHVTD